MVRVTEAGIETTDAHREHDVLVWATGFDFGTGAMLRMGIAGRDGLALAEHWAGGPTTTRPPATTPRTTATRSTSSPTRWSTRATTVTTPSSPPPP